jgi:hypothetical protein
MLVKQNHTPTLTPFDTYTHTHTHESLTNYVALMWVEVGQPCPKEQECRPEK